MDTHELIMCKWCDLPYDDYHKHDKCEEYLKGPGGLHSLLTKEHTKPELVVEHDKMMEYIRRRARIKEVPIGPISEKLLMLQGYLHDQGEEPYIELKTQWLQEMINEINEKVQGLLKAIHDD